MEEFIKILIVDDDEVDRMAVCRSLRSAGIDFLLSEARDYPSTISALHNASFDCIFLDYRLPGRDGLMLVKDLRQANIRIPLIVLTGQGDEQIAVELMKAGASDYLPKSKIAPGVLARILRNAIRIHRAEMEAELVKQQREQLTRQREDFVHRLTHDLRTPLVAADRMLTLFQQEAFGALTPEMEDSIAIMIRSNQNLLQMVNTILEVYRHDAGYKTLNLVSCDLQHIIQEVIQELIPLANEKGLKLITDYGEPIHNQLVTSVKGDRFELRRVFTNLIGNAIKFTDKGIVSVRLSVSDTTPLPSDETSAAQAPFVAVEIKDTGAGITAEDQQILFDRFRQGSNKRSGSGLGLYLSKRIVEAHSGWIAVKSEPGRGSLFTVHLPLQLDKAISSPQESVNRHL